MIKLLHDTDDETFESWIKSTEGNEMKKLLTALFTMVAAIMLITSVPVEAAQPKLNKTKMTMYEGQKKTLKVNKKAKVKWSSSNKKVATVNQKGQVFAKKKGTVIIKAKIGKRVIKCKVTVKKPHLSETISFTYQECQFPVKLVGAKPAKWWVSNRNYFEYTTGFVTTHKVPNGGKRVYLYCKDTLGRKYKCKIYIMDNHGLVNGHHFTEYKDYFRINPDYDYKSEWFMYWPDWWTPDMMNKLD